MSSTDQTDSIKTYELTFFNGETEEVKAERFEMWARGNRPHWFYTDNQLVVVHENVWKVAVKSSGESE